LNEDKETPRLNNHGEAYYSTIICNQSKGSSPKSKVNKIKKAMLTKEEYDPLDVHLGLPTTETFYKRIVKVKVCPKSNDKNFITHIQRPRDNEWECIEGEFDGTINSISDPVKVFKSMQHKINKKEIDYATRSFFELLRYYSDKNGNLIFNLDQTDKCFGKADKTRHGKFIEFLRTKEVIDLQNLIGGRLV
jgi:hypothetical protein